MRKLALLIVLLMLAAPAYPAEDLTVREAHSEVTLMGYTRARDSMTVAPEASGRVIAVNYDVGAIVGNSPLAELDDTFIGLEIEQAGAALAQIEIEGRRADSRAEYLRKEYARTESLHEGHRATEVKLDEAREGLRQAELGAEALRRKVEAQQALMAELEERRARHKVHAPMGWTITHRAVEPGEVIAQGTPIARVGDFRRMVVPLAVSGDELAALQALPARFKADLEGSSVKASIGSINPEFDEKTRKLAIEIELAETGGIRPRGGLQLTIPLKVRGRGVLIPRAALTSRYDSPWVTLLDGSRVRVVILGEVEGFYRVAAHAQLKPGTRLLPAK